MIGTMLITAISALLLLQSNSPAALPLKNVIAGLNERKFAKIAAQYVGGKVIPSEAAAFANLPREYRFSITVTSVQVSGNSGKVTARLKATGMEQSEMVNVVRDSGTWKIVPLKKTPAPQSLFDSLGVSVTKGGLFKQARTASTNTATMSNAKQTALAVMLYLGDHNDKFSFAADDLSGAVLPYLKNEKILLSKGTGKPFTFNKRLTGTKAVDIALPAKTVLLYEGSNERFTFTDGKTVVAFTDGHVRLLTPETVKSVGLRWKP